MATRLACERAWHKARRALVAKGVTFGQEFGMVRAYQVEERVWLDVYSDEAMAIVREAIKNLTHLCSIERVNRPRRHLPHPTYH